MTSRKAPPTLIPATAVLTFARLALHELHGTTEELFQLFRRSLPLDSLPLFFTWPRYADGIGDGRPLLGIGSEEHTVARVSDLDDHREKLFRIFPRLRLKGSVLFADRTFEGQMLDERPDSPEGQPLCAPQSPEKI